MTLYLPSDSELADGIGAWDTDRENGHHVPVLASFEQDRYARLLQEHGSTPYALLSGSVGSTTVARGAW